MVDKNLIQVIYKPTCVRVLKRPESKSVHLSLTLNNPRGYKKAFHTNPSRIYYATYIFEIRLCLHTLLVYISIRATLYLFTETIMTTVPPSTTTTPPPKYCKAIGAWNMSKAVDAWCEIVCNHDPPYCPETHCFCSFLQFPVRLILFST